MKLLLLISFLSIQFHCISSRHHSPTEDEVYPIINDGPAQPSLKTSDVSSLAFLDPASDEIAHYQRRRQDEVEILDSFRCLVTTSLKTERYISNIGAKGIMFNIESVDDTELLSLEFAVGRDAPASIEVQVYYREGSFSGVNGRPEEWTQVADTLAQVSPDSKTAIVPAEDFGVIEMKANTEYALYVSLQTTDVLKLYSSVDGIGYVYDTDGIMQRKVGVLFNEGPFPQTLGDGQAAEFEGVLHYKSPQICTDILTTTDVEVEFAVNDDPTERLMSELSQSVMDAMGAIIVLDPVLGQYKKTQLLKVREVTPGFNGRSEEKCPAEYEMCSLVTATITFEHLQSVQAGSLQRYALSNAEELGDSVTAISDGFEVIYIGEPVVEAQFEIIFDGLSEQMVAIQRRYFERISSEFLAQFVEGLPAYEVEVLEENVEGKIAETAGGTTEDETRNLARNLAHSNLRGSARQLQAALHVIISTYGSGALSDLRASVLDAVDSNKDRYMNELRLQQLRPGEINENGLGSFFNSISDTRIYLWSSESGGGGYTDDSEKISPVWMPVSIIGVIVSSLWIIYRCYEDFRRTPNMEKWKDHQDEIDDTPHQQQSFDDLPPQTFAGDKRRQRSLDRLPVGKGPRMEAPVNMAGRNGGGVARRNSMPMGGRPRSLDRLPVGKGPNDAYGGAPSLNRASSNRGLPASFDVSDSNALPKRGKRPPSLDRLLSENNPRPPRRLSSSASVPVKATSSNTFPKKGKRPASLDRLLSENNPRPPRRLSSIASFPVKATSFDELPPQTFAGEKRRPRSLDRLPVGKGPPMEAPVNMDSGLMTASTSWKENLKRKNSLTSASTASSSREPVTSSSSREPVRRVKKTRSMEGLRPPSVEILWKENLNRKNSLTSASTSSSSREPVRGVKKTRSMEGLRPPSVEILWKVKRKNSLTSASTSSNSRQPVRGVKKTRSMEGLSSTKKPRRPRSLDRLPVGKGPTMEAPVNIVSGRTMDSDLTSASTSSSSRQPVRGVKKTRSMEGLSSTEKSRRPRSLDRLPVGKGPTMEAPVNMDSSLTSASTSSSSRQPFRGFKKTPSMESLSTMKKRRSAMWEELERGVKETRSLEGMPKVAKKKQLVPLAASNHSLQFRNTDNKRDSESESDSDYSSESSNDSEFESPKRAVPKKSLQKAGRNILDLDKRMVDDASSSEESDFSNNSTNGDYKVAVSYQQRKQNSKTKLLETKPKIRDGEEGDSDESIIVPPRKKKSSKKKRLSASDGELKGIRGRQIPKERKTVRSISMDGKVTTKTWWELKNEEKST